MANGRPVVNDGEKYINGLSLGWTDGTNITVAAGQARDSDNINDIVLSSAITIDAATNGANGLDQGSLANSSLYAVYVIGNSLDSSAAAGLLVLDGSTPLMPVNYDMSRRIGYVLTSGAGAILKFYQYGEDKDRWMFYDAEISVLAAGAAIAYTDVDMSAAVPSGAKQVRLKCAYTPALATRAALIRPNGATAAEGYVHLLAPAAAEMILMQDVPCDEDAVIEYILENAADALSLDVRAYQDSL